MKDIKNWDVKANSFFGGVGYLKEIGEYAGEYMEEAYDALGIEGELEENEWCDICVADNGKTYAVYGDTEATSYGTFYFLEVKR